MASWVSPSVASEMLNTTISDLLARAGRGELRTMKHGDFIFVDIDPTSTAPIEASGKPATYSVVTREEERALFEPIEFSAARPMVAATRKPPIAA